VDAGATARDCGCEFGAGASINEVAQRLGIRPNLFDSVGDDDKRGITAVTSLKLSGPGSHPVQIKTVAIEGTIEIDQASGLVRVRGTVDAGMLREVLAATR